MKNKMNYMTFAMALMLMVGCNKSLTKSSLEDIDTLKVSDVNFEVEGKEVLLNEYYSRFGIAIPKFYVVKDSTPIDLNQDKVIDTLVILSPIILEDKKYSGFKSTSPPNRLMVELLNQGKKSKIRNIYENVISNTGGVLSKYSGIIVTGNGFSISHQSGSRYSWTIVSEFGTSRKDSIVLISFERICSLEGFEERFEYKFNNGSALGFNINDTIKNNCSCDSLWKNLEKRLEK